MNVSVEYATPEYLHEIQKLTEQRISEIRSARSDIVPAGGGRSYYVSANGSDSFDGLTPESAWATLNKVNNHVYTFGDAVYFERGGLWRGQLSAKSGVSYSAYGTGNKPALYASPENAGSSDKWIETSVPHIYLYYKKLDKDVGTIVFNHGEAHAIKCIIRTEKDGSTYNNTTGKPFTDYSDLIDDLHFYHDKSDGTVYLRSDNGNPGVLYSSIELNIREHVISIHGDNVTIDNLCIKYGGAHGIGSGTVSGLNVKNCEFGWIGGSIQAEGIFGRNYATRYGNAVEIYGGCMNYTVDNCYIYQVYDAGVTQQYNVSKTDSPHNMINVRYSNNVMEYCDYSVEYFLSMPAENENSRIENFTIENNIMRFAGYGFCQQRPDKTDAAHIKSWNSANPIKNYIIRNNIMQSSFNMMVHIASMTNNPDYGNSEPLTECNTYIQELNGSYGIIEQHVTQRRPYDSDIADYIKARDSKAKVYFTSK